MKTWSSWARSRDEADPVLVGHQRKRTSMHRKNSLYYCSTTGTKVGDAFMSLIHSAELNGIEPFEYLIELLNYPEEVERERSA